MSVQAKSTESVSSTLPDIPSAPAVPSLTDQAPELLDVVAAVGAEPTFASLGLAQGYWPIGIIQSILEWLHIGCDLPWWGCIAVMTVLCRTLMFPIVAIAQRNAARLHNVMPEVQAVQLKMTEARQCANHYEAAKYSQELMKLMKERKVNPLKNMLGPLCQAPIFISFFIGLRRMVNAPVESLHEGGALWFTDLTVPDPYYILPVITCATLFATIKVGADGAAMTSQNMQTMKYVLNALPVVMFPFIMNFPGAILCYWCTSNSYALVQVRSFHSLNHRALFTVFFSACRLHSSK